MAGTVGAEHDWQLDAGVQAAANPDVAMIERGGMEADDGFARAGVRIRSLFDLQMFGIAQRVEDNGSHRKAIVNCRLDSVRLKPDTTDDPG